MKQTLAPERDLSRGDWMQTASGRQFFPLDPHLSDICFSDIAHALSNICRFGGHCREFYSVAQHSVYVAKILPPELKLYGLLHDATEAYLGDIPRPLKYLLPAYKNLEKRLARVIENHFGLEPYCFDNPAIKYADNVILMTEARDLLGPKPDAWGVPVEPADFKILPLTPVGARIQFEQTFKALAQ